MFLLYALVQHKIYLKLFDLLSVSDRFYQHWGAPAGHRVCGFYQHFDPVEQLPLTLLLAG